MVPYKKIELIVETFSKEFPDKELIVIGDGPDFKKIKKIAKKNIQLLGQIPPKELLSFLSQAKAFIFASEEDFGIAPIEAQSCGTPVIAYKKGAAKETIIGIEDNDPTGVFFEEQTVKSLASAIDVFEKNHSKISYENCIRNAERFSIDRFRSEFKTFVELKFKEFEEKR